MAEAYAERELTPDGIVAAASVCQQAMAPHADADWSVTAGSLDWDCRRTLDHIADALCSYSGSVANRADHRMASVRSGNPTATPAQLVEVLGTAANILAVLTREMPSEARAFHPAGMADATGFVGMACTETLVHGYDISQGLGFDLQPPGELCASVIRRLFPWVTDLGDPWQTLLWTTGRISLSDRAGVEPDWYWQCAPLAEWDGTVRRRAKPPASR